MSTTSSALGLPDVSDDLAARLRDGLDRVATRIDAVVDADDPFVAEVAHHLLDAGGKRIRPLLALLVAQLGEGITDDVVTAAASVELIHQASLCHDDVMDEADLRRGVPSVNAAYDNSTAIMVGDLLFGQASALVAELGAEAVKIQAETFVRLCAGQIRDARPRPAGVDEEEYYLGVLRDKTGALIATTVRYGAMFSGQEQDTIERLTHYGELLGLVFQLADDVLDIASDTSGKTPGTDLREGVATLPVLYARESTDPKDARLVELLRKGALTDDAEHAEALALLREHPALDQARDRTREYAEEAVHALDGLPAGEVRDCLTHLVQAMADRAV